LLSFNRSNFLTVNAEIFSRFSELMNAKAHYPVYVVGCANGMIGYVSSAEAYVEGGYEVAWSMLFYNQPRLQKGSLELLAQHAGHLLEGLSTKKLSTPDSPPKKIMFQRERGQDFLPSH
jgi:hypothetical protein